MRDGSGGGRVHGMPARGAQRRGRLSTQGENHAEILIAVSVFFSLFRARGKTPDEAVCMRLYRPSGLRTVGASEVQRDHAGICRAAATRVMRVVASMGGSVGKTPQTGCSVMQTGGRCGLSRAETRQTVTRCLVRLLWTLPVDCVCSHDLCCTQCMGVRIDVLMASCSGGVGRAHGQGVCWRWHASLRCTNHSSR